ncbi:MAG TPA: CHAT domain-containing protein [Bryobacteraceae bacterium]|nr:CHAT domain-containing protein [Bryobacteraceae bacterium]HPT26563.1 CHAT domain-containing protein [Bryobacteraceae bacterium]
MSSSKSAVGWSSVALLSVLGVQAVHCQERWSQRELQAAEFFRASRYQQAEVLYHSERLAAGRRGDEKAYIRLTSNLASCRYAQFDYRSAVSLYEEVRARAIRKGERESAGVALVNLSSVYSSQWEPDASDASIREAALYLSPSSRFYPALKAQEAAMEARRMRHHASFQAAREAAFAADARSDPSLVAQVWNRAGLLSLALNRLDEAEVYLTEAFRLRRLHKLPFLESSYRSLARLRLLQRRPAEARVLIAAAERARLSAPTRGAQWAWEADKAAVLAANGETRLARLSYSAALAQARAWRSAVLPVQSSVLASEVSAAQIAGDYASLLAASARPGVNDPSAVASLLVLETARAEAFQSELIYSAWRQQILGPDYARALSQLRRAESNLLLRRDEPTRVEAQRCRAQVASIEARLGVSVQPRPAGAGGAPSLPAAPPDAVWLSFKLGPERSWLWIMTSSGVRIAALPPAPAISRLSGDLRSAILANGDWLAQASALHDALFSSLTPAESAKPHWRLSLDGPLYEIPFAALARPTFSGRQPLALDHTFTVVASLLAPHAEPPSALAGSRFVGVGDAVYNQSDARLSVSALPRRSPNPWFTLGAASPVDSDEWDLPRLPGAAFEIQSAAAILESAGAKCDLLTGRRVSLDEIAGEIARPPSILHFAAHVLSAPASGVAVALSRNPSPGAAQFVRPGEVFIALGRGPDGRQQLLSSTSIASRFRVNGSLVVLSGCGSARGAALPGAGLQGMTRAWLSASARSVVGSLWSQPDSSEHFFKYLYSSLVQGAELRSALQAAQTAMLRSRDWRNQPRHWAGWILVGKER